MKLLPTLACCTLLAAAATPALAQRTGHPRDIVDTAVAAGSFETLATALKTAGLIDALKGDGPFTVFAPTDDAFAKLPRGTVESLLRPESRDTLTAILTYHVVPGRLTAADVIERTNATTLGGQRIRIAAGNGVRIDDANVIKTDIACRNGVIHVIDTVLMPRTDDLAATAASAGSFGTLLAAARAAGLDDALANDGPFTVFAPTDDAFRRVPAATLEALLRPENREQLRTVLAFHVVPGRVYSDQAAGAGSAESLAKSRLRFRIDDGRLRVNDASVVTNDVQAANGVIHVIDAVLIPPALTLSERSARSPSELIELAVERGAPMYNAGQPEACAAIYEVTIEALLASLENKRWSELRGDLTRALNQSGGQRDARDRAWTLRRALDRAYDTLSH